MILSLKFISFTMVDFSKYFSDKPLYMFSCKERYIKNMHVFRRNDFIIFQYKDTKN